jgi:hypothetical protein
MRAEGQSIHAAGRVVGVENPTVNKGLATLLGEHSRPPPGSEGLTANLAAK